MDNSDVLYSSAIDPDGVFVDIHDVDKSQKIVYKCPACYDIMKARQGEVRQWHFAHTTSPCDEVIYLQTIAKYKLYDWYNSQDEVILGYVDKVVSYDCKPDCLCKPSCNLANQSIEHTSKLNLKTLFPNLIIESDENNKQTDLFSEDKCFSIEMSKFRRFSKKKAKEGIKVIEFDISEEYQIQKILTSNVIDSNLVKLYNFPEPVASQEVCPAYCDKQILSEKLRRVKRWFDESEHIFLKYNITEFCLKFGRCKHHIDECNERLVHKEIDLKQRKFTCQVSNGFLKISNPLYNKTFCIEFGTLPYFSGPTIRVWDVDSLLSNNFFEESELVEFHSFKKEIETSCKYK